VETGDGNGATVIPLHADRRMRAESAPHSADLVAFLFTDIEGSSVRWLNHRAAMQEAVRQHDALLRTAIVAAGGTVFKTGGDAFNAAFRRPSDAVSAALAAQRALGSRDWSAIGGMAVRMAVHVGTAEQRDGDYFGPAVNRVARLLALGHGGQILVTSSVAELLLAERESQGGLRLLGAHPLDDPLQAVGVHQVEAPGLRAEFPPLRTADNRPTNLPRQVTPLIGRNEEIERLRALIVSNTLVTITGTGGVGKTRLALEAGAQLLDGFADGVWLVELAAISDPVMVPGAVNSALGVDASTDQTPMAALISRVKRQELMLLLDNCEHVIDAVAQLVEAVLAVAPKVRVVTSSQEPLGIAGEQVFRLPSLALPEGSALSAETALQSGAVQLFVERARAADPRFLLDDRNASTVAAICRRLDGIALAIEMAAARVQMLGVDKLAEKLDERFRVLTGGRRTALPRQQTLRATLDWSHGLLSDAERRVLRRASIFSGGFTLDAASAVIADESIDEFEVIDQLSHLVARSLVVADDTESGTRYRLLETTRAYALEKLAEADETRRCEQRHAEYYERMYSKGYADWYAYTDLEWRLAYLPDRDNLRTALDWAFGPDGDIALGIALSAGAVRLWRHMSLVSEGRQRLEAALPHVTSGTPALHAARIWEGVGQMWSDGDVNRSLMGYERAVALYRELGHKASLADNLINFAGQGLMMSKRMSLPFTKELLDAALPLMQSCGFPRVQGRYHITAGIIASMNRDDSTAQVNFQRALDLFRSAGSDRGTLLALGNLCDVRWLSGDLDGAIADMSETVARVRQSPTAARNALGNPLGNLAGALTERGDLAGALAAAREALPIVREDGSAWYYLDHMALRLALSGKFEDAARVEGYTDGVFRTQGMDTRQPNEDRLRKRLLAILHEKLAPDDLARLLAEGATLSGEEACRLAMEQ
jgi:predicted ATPase/class 3 adenylate cyclase